MYSFSRRARLDQFGCNFQQWNMSVKYSLDLSVPVCSPVIFHAVL